MKILTRSTVFRTAALAGLFSLMLALGGVFFGVTASVHATTADQVTDEETLKEFVESAVDEYYIKFLLQGEDEHCDLTDLPDRLPPALATGLPGYLAGLGLPIADLTPASMRKLTTEQVKSLLNLFNSPGIQNFIGDDFDMWEDCTPLPPNSTFRDVFTAPGEEEKWKSGSVHLFVLQYMDSDPKQAIIFHGENKDIENIDATNLTDASGTKIMPLLLRASTGALPPRTQKGFADYCFDDPTTVNDDFPDDGDILTASGDSWKTSYVVDPFEYLGAVAPPGSPTILFGSGIYPKMETANKPPECNIYTDEEPPPTTPPATPPTTPPTTGGGDSGSGDSGGGGCAIAAGSDGTPQGIAFNLLLIASALFFTVSFAGRAAGGRNGTRS